MSPAAATAAPGVEALVGYAPTTTVVADDERPGLLRSPRRPSAGERDSSQDDVVYERCTIHDLDAAEDPPGFLDAGFEAVRLPEAPGLIDLLGEIRDAGRADDDRAARLRGLLTRTSVALADGSQLRIDFVADEGVIVRQAGPAGVPVDGAAHHGAVNVHIDQDVLGTPLRQIFSGGAAEVFAHDSPDTRNRTATQHLVNLWLPLHQITRPLTLMDGRTLDRPRHQLRYHLPVDGFLDRDDERSVNDIWLCLHDPAQQWWYRPVAGPGDAYVFDTLSTPHASFVSPGEDVAADRYRRVGTVLEAVRNGEPVGGSEPAEAPDLDLDPATSDALRAAIAELDAVLATVPSAGGDADAWCARAELARDAVVRCSLELRAVVTHLPAPA